MPHPMRKRLIIFNLLVMHRLDDKGAIPDGYLDNLSVIFKWIFSWFVLMPIAVIISGTLLAKPLRLHVASRQRFVIPIPKILHLEAKNGEVILGFAGFIITLVIMALVCGQNVYLLFRSQFGIDPGQFNSLCILSSFITVIWAVVIWLIDKARKASPDPSAIERDELILNLTKGWELEPDELILNLEKDRKVRNDE